MNRTSLFSVDGTSASGVTHRISEKAPHARTTMTTTAALFAHNTAYPEAPNSTCESVLN